MKKRHAQFILLVSKYCKINLSNYFKEKLEQTVEFMKNEFLNEEGLLGTAYDADSEGKKVNITFLNLRI